MNQCMSSGLTPYSSCSRPFMNTTAVDPYCVVPTRLPRKSAGDVMPAPLRT